MVHIFIDGKTIKAREGEMLLATLRREGIDVPALCHHETIEPCGSCRMCTVEITKDGWGGWKRYVTACLYPVEEGLSVATHTPELIEIRKTILDLFLARCPNSDVIQKMAEEYGVLGTSYETVPDGDNCIMCYACTRICEVLGKSAISAVMRGHKKAIAPPLGDQPPDCIGCLSCAHICPTDVIAWKDEGGIRSIWNKPFELLSCSRCGKKTITREFADYLIEKRNLPKEYFTVCDDCKRQDLARKMGALVDQAKEATV